MKKIITIVMTILLISSVFVGCKPKTTKGLSLAEFKGFPKFEETIIGDSFISQEPYLDTFKDNFNGNYHFESKTYEAQIASQPAISSSSIGKKDNLVYFKSQYDDTDDYYIVDDDYYYDLSEKDKSYSKYPIEECDDDLYDLGTDFSTIKYEKSYNVIVNDQELVKEVCVDTEYNAGTDFYYDKEGRPIYIYQHMYELTPTLMIFTEYTTDIDDSLFEIPDDYAILNDDITNQNVSDYVDTLYQPEICNGMLNIGEAFDNFFANPEWIGYEEDNNLIVEFHGECTYYDDNVTIVVTMIPNENLANIVKLEIDGEDVTDSLLKEFFASITESYC